MWVGLSAMEPKNYINELLSELSSRLPELEWKLSNLGAFFSRRSLPRGLFSSNMELSGAACIEEIKSDIKVLSEQKNTRSAQYFAERIQQKINVLVSLCQINAKKNKPEGAVYFGVKMLSTRQQWIKTLENDIETLVTQQQAMLNALEQNKLSTNVEVMLSVQAELGEVERRLTLAKEELKRAVS